MSNKQNEQWLENAREWFTEALETENWALCRAIIGDVKDISPSSAILLERELVAAQKV